MAGKATKRDVIARRLRTMIESGDLARGARVHQDDLASRFNTSITPVREALRLLEAEGLLVSEPHRGVRVSEINLEEVHGVYVARRLIEPFATALATGNISRRQLAVAQGHLETLEAARADGDGDAATVLASNRAFHFVLYEACDIPWLVTHIETLWLGFPWDVLEVVQGRQEESSKEHAEIMDAMREGSSLDAGAATERHIRNSFHALATHLSGEQPARDPFDLLGR